MALVIRRLSTNHFSAPKAASIVLTVRIGQLAARTGLPVKTIRYYSDIGVLPETGRTSSGYRDYDDAALGRVRFIRSAQSVGLSLGEIREIVALRDHGETPCTHVAQLVGRRADEIDQRIADLEILRDELRRLDRRARTLDPADCAPDLVCHVIVPANP